MYRDLFKKLAIGFITGVLCGLFSSGGGLILVPFITKFLAKSEKKSRAISIFCILIMVGTCIIIYHNLEKPNVKTAIYCAAGGVIGAIIGTKIMTKINDKILVAIFILFTIYASITLFVKS